MPDTIAGGLAEQIAHQYTTPLLQTVHE